MSWPAMVTRAVHIPATAGVPPSATRRHEVAGVKTFRRRHRSFALMTDTCAPVSMSALTSTPSTFTSNKFFSARSVIRGFSGRSENAASPPGAASSSFPGRVSSSWSAGSARKSDEENGTGDAAAMGNDQTSGCRRNQRCSAAADGGSRSVEEGRQGTGRSCSGGAEMDGSGSIEPRGLPVCS